MSNTAICTDSSALLPADAVERFGISVVPLSVTLDGKVFDERSRDTDDFYAQLERGAEAKTSQPNPAAFADAYAQAGRLGKRHVLSIHLDARISGTSNSAELASHEAEIPVTVVDTKTVSFGVAVCVRAAAQALTEGASAPEAARVAIGLGAEIQNVFVARGGPDGRVPERNSWTVLAFADGAATPVALCASADAAINEMAARVQEEGQAVETAVGYAGAVVEGSADLLASVIGRSPHVVSMERYRVGPSIGAHTGSTSFGLFWWPTAS